MFKAKLFKDFKYFAICHFKLNRNRKVTPNTTGTPSSGERKPTNRDFYGNLKTYEDNYMNIFSVKSLTLLPLRVASFLFSFVCLLVVFLLSDSTRFEPFLNFLDANGIV